MLNRMGEIIGIVVIAFSAICTTIPLRADDESEARGGEVLDAYVAATGGEAAYDAVSTRVTHLKFQISGIELQAVTYQARPGMSHTIIQSEAVGTIEKGTNGEVVWEKSLMSGPVVKHGDEEALIIRSSNLDVVSHWRDFFEDARYQGMEDIGGRACHKVLLVGLDNGPDETRFFDVETGLLARTDMKIDFPAGTVSVELSVDDYQETDGLLLPRKVVQKAAGTSTVIEVDQIEHNTEIEKSHFELPSDIRALVEESAERE